MTMHKCRESPAACYRHAEYSVHAVFGGGFQVYDPAHEVYVGSDGKAISDTRGKKWWTGRDEASAVADRLNRRDGRYA